jgi:hypothetical protein
MCIGKLVERIACGAVIFVASVAMNAQSIDGSLSVLELPFRSVTFGSAAPEKSTTPFFSHGYVIQFRHITTSADQPNIFLYSSSGELEQQITVWPRGITKLFIASVDVGSNRQLVFSGQFTKIDNSKSEFIAISGIDGKNPRFFNTGNYMATQISIADDESIWSVGAEKAKPSANGEMRWDNYDILRHFDPNGTLLGHLIPRWGSQASYAIRQAGASGVSGQSGVADDTVATDSTSRVVTYNENGNYLATYGAPLWGPQGGYAGTSSQYNQSWLRSSGNGIILYDGRSGILYSYNASSRTLQTQGVDISHSQDVRINGFAISSAGKILASIKTNYGTHSSGLGVFELVADPSGGLSTWSHVKSSKSMQRLMAGNFSLLGSDGTAIVYRTSTGLVNWSALQ